MLVDEASLLWRVDKGVAFAPTDVDPLSPNARYFTEQANEGLVREVALSSKSAWYLTDKGAFVQMRLPEMGILFRTDPPAGNAELDQITATDHAVWALRKDTGKLVVRVGLKHCPMGMDWVEDW